jgi:hypothetical protein
VSKNKKKRKGGQHAPPPPSLNVVDELAQLACDIAQAEEAGPLWGKLHKVLLRSTVDPAVAGKIIMHRDESELAKAIEQLQSGDAVTLESEVEAAPANEIPFETKKKAMRVFRNRVKYLKLDQESKLGVGPLTSGKEMKFDSIAAPHEFPSEVWQALAKEDQLIDDGGGFYRLP